MTNEELVAILPKESWVRRWVEAWPYMEAPRSYLILDALCMLGATIGRAAHFDQDDKKVWPMLNLLLIGASGIGKSRTIDLGKSLFAGIPNGMRPQVISGAATMEKLHFDLCATPHAIVIASELANFFSRQKYMEGMIPYVTELLDNNDTVERRTQKDSLLIVNYPQVTILGGSTPEWLQTQLPDSATTGGFLARFFILTEEHKARKVALPGKMLTRKATLDIEMERAKLRREFLTLAHTAIGTIDFENYDAADRYTEWYSTHRPLTGHLAPFAQRAGEFILRVAMLLAFSCGRLHIAARDIDTAIKLYTYAEGRLQEVVVPFTAQGRLLKELLTAIGTKDMTRMQLRRAMRNFATAQDTDRLIISLLGSGDLTEIEEGKFRRNQ